MTDDDRGLAALAAALPVHSCFDQCEGDTHRWCLTQAAAILGERGVFLPDGLPLAARIDLFIDGKREEMEAEIARLRRRCKEESVDVRDRMGEWVPVCGRHALAPSEDYPRPDEDGAL